MPTENCFGSSDGRLRMDSVDLTGLARKYGTPLLVTSERRLVGNFRRLDSAFRKHYTNLSINYAIKANPNPSIISVLAREGARADASSIAEVGFARMGGVKMERILFSPNYAYVEELKYALDKDLAINFDDIGQLEALAEYGVPKLVSFRLNPGIGAGEFRGLVTAGPLAKFGIPARHIGRAYRLAKERGAQRFGIHMMAGSNVLRPEHFASTTAKTMDVAGAISEKLGIDFEFVDIGGGFGVPYRPEERPMDIERTARLVTGVFKDKCSEYGMGKPTLMLEPGRYLVADTTVLLGAVNHVKRYSRTFIGTDIGMNVNMRPALYGAYHEVAIANRMNERAAERASVTGQICENTDIVARDRRLPAARIGDIIAMFNAGAYVYSMSNQFCSRPRPAEVLVKRSGAVKLIRRRESMKDLCSTLPTARTSGFK